MQEGHEVKTGGVPHSDPRWPRFSTFMLAHFAAIGLALVGFGLRNRLWTEQPSGPTPLERLQEEALQGAARLPWAAHVLAVDDLRPSASPDSEVESPVAEDPVLAALQADPGWLARLRQTMRTLRDRHQPLQIQAAKAWPSSDASLRFLAQRSALRLTMAEPAFEGSENLSLQVFLDGKPQGPFEFPLRNVVIGPLREEGSWVNMRGVLHGFLGSSTTHESNLSTAKLAAQQGSFARQSLKSRSGNDPDIALSARLLPFDANANSGDDGDPRHPRPLKPGAEPAIDDEVRYESADASDYTMVEAQGRVSVVIVWADRLLANHAACYRADTQQRIGVASTTQPIFAAVVDGHSNLLVSLVAPEPDDAVHYRLFALSGDAEVTATALLRFLGEEMLPWDNGHTRRDVDRLVAARWLMQVLGIQAADLRAKVARSPKPLQDAAEELLREDIAPTRSP